MKRLLCCSLLFLATLEAFNINSNPSLTVNEAGNAVALWEAYNGNNIVIQKASRPNGSSWGAPVSVSSAGNNAADSELAMNAMGKIIGVWQRASSGAFIVESDTLSFGGADALKTISTETQGPLSPSVGIDASGNGVALWHRVQGTSKYIVMTSSYLFSSGLWGAPVSINPTNPSLALPLPSVAVNDSGKAIAVWQQLNSRSSDSSIQAAFLPFGGAWTFPATLSTSLESARSPHVAIDSSGNVMVVWHESKGAISIVVARFCSSSGDWENSVTLSAQDNNAMNAQVALNDSGKAVVAWEKSTSSSNSIIQAAVFSGTSWGAPTDLSSASVDASLPQVALNASGEAIVSWSAENMSSDFLIQTNFLSTGGSWGGAETISDSSLQSRFNQLKFDGAGNAIAVWEAISGGTSVIQANFRPTGSVWGMAETVSVPIP